MVSNVLIIAIGATIFTANLVDNTSVEGLKNILSKKPITIKMDDYGNFEKVGDIGTTLPRNDIPMNTGPGDIILYQGKSISIYYETNSYSLTPIGKIENVSKDELKKVLGDGSVYVNFSLANHIYENGAVAVGGNKLSTGAIVGIVIACVVFVVGIMIGEFFIVKHYIKKGSISVGEG